MKLLSSIITFMTFLSACAQPQLNALTLSPTPTPRPNATQAIHAWETLAPGIERRIYRPGADYALTQFTALRIDPALNEFRVHYRAGEPLHVFGWRDLLPDANAFINANFFDHDDHILGLLVSDGVVYGEAYQNMGGMLYVQEGIVRVRSTIVEPYQQGEPMSQAVQAFPMLITDGQASFNNDAPDRASRRTIVGQDSEGRIILMVTSSLIGIRLVDLSQYLATTDLDLVTAFNLDGGRSTMLWMRSALVGDSFVPSLDAVPAILAIYPK